MYYDIVSVSATFLVCMLVYDYVCICFAYSYYYHIYAMVTFTITVIPRTYHIICVVVIVH